MLFNHYRQSRNNRTSPPVEQSRPPGFICNGWQSYVDIYRSEYEAFCTKGLNKESKQQTGEPRNHPTLLDKLFSPSIEESYDKNGQFDALCLSKYNLKRSKQSRKIMTAEEAKSMITEAKKAVATEEMENIDENAEKAVSTEEDSVGRDTSSTQSDPSSEEEARQTMVDSQLIQQPNRNKQLTYKESLADLCPILVQLKNKTNQGIIVSVLLKNGMSNIILIEARNRTTIFLKVRTADKCLQMLNHTFLPCYNYYIKNKKDLFQASNPLAEYFYNVPNKIISENRTVRLSLKKLDSYISFVIQESFEMVKLEKDVVHEINVPAHRLPLFVEQLNKVLQKIKSDRMPPEQKNDTNLEDVAKLKEVLNFSYINSNSKRFIRVHETISRNQFVVLSLSAAIECAYNLNTFGAYYDSLKNKLPEVTLLTFMMTRNVQCKNQKRRFLVNFGVNCEQYFISIRDTETRKNVLISADLIKALRQKLIDTVYNSGACHKCSTPKEHHANDCYFSCPIDQDTNNNIPRITPKLMDSSDYERDELPSPSTNNHYHQKDQRSYGRIMSSQFSYNSHVGNFKPEK